MSKLSEKISKQVKGLKKRPKWQFILKRILIWAILIFAVIAGAIAFSMILFQLQLVDWDIHPKLKEGAIKPFFRVLPYFWLSISAILLTIIYFDYKQTKSGYKHSGGVIIITALITSIVFGSILYSVKLSEKLEYFFQRQHTYQQLHHNPKDFWISPEEGLLGGKIIELHGQNFTLEDFHQKMWNIDTSKPDLKGKVFIKQGYLIKIIGEPTGPLQFKAEELRPWKPRAN